MARTVTSRFNRNFIGSWSPANPALQDQPASWMHSKAAEWETLALTADKSRFQELGNQVQVYINSQSAISNFWASVLENLRETYRTRFLTPEAKAEAAVAVETAQAIAKVETAPQTAEAMKVPAVGYYTVAEASGSHVTFRVKPHWENPNSLVVGYLSGPENTTDYMNFGEFKDGRFKLWRRFEGGLSRQRAALSYLVNGNQEEALFLYATTSGRCGRCGRTLTVPASIHRGLGPECARKVG